MTTFNQKRRRQEQLFAYFNGAAAAASVLFLIILMTSIVIMGSSALFEARLRVDIENVPASTQSLAPYRTAIRDFLTSHLNVTTRKEKRELYRLISVAADGVLRDKIQNMNKHPAQLSLWLPASALVDDVMNGRINLDDENSYKLVSSQQRAWIAQLEKEGRLSLFFNTTLFTQGAATTPERAGLYVALIGSLMMMLIVALTAIPIGVAAALYLEEFAPRKKFVLWLEMLINNLAAVPSIVFGIFGLAIFINMFQLPRSAPLVGGLVLALMTLPTIIIATRAALSSVPNSIRQGALALGASHHQMVFHHVLPLSLPAIMTGSIIGLSQALGESAPLLLIGMVAFIADAPQNFLEPASALPVQIFMWAGAAERGFTARAAAAILVLISFLLIMNSLAIYIRKKYTKKFR